MSKFIQLHVLTAYGPSNLNRDDLGRPKSVLIGGKNRLRVSSQSLKRAWRTSDVFHDNLKGHLGTRTKRAGELVYKVLTEGNIPEEKARTLASELVKQLGAVKKEKKDKPLNILQNETLTLLAPEELEKLQAIAKQIVAEGGEAGDNDQVLTKEIKAADVAMFGRMLASSTEFNMEAAVQVSHAFTTHEAIAQDDFFTAVDDLNSGDEDAGAGHMGELEFGAGVFYTYICIDRDQLLRNLQGDKALANRAIASLIEAATTVSPSGKQNSFASRAYANYALAERGKRQPRSLAHAFVNPVSNDFIHGSIQALKDGRENLDKVYGPCAESFVEFDASQGKGSLSALIEFAQEHT